MSVCRKLPDGTVQKIAGHTILLDANASEVRAGTFTIQSTAAGQANTNVVFSDPMPDADYMVIYECSTWGGYPVNTEPSWVSCTQKTTTGFIASLWAFEAMSAPARFRYWAFKPVKIEGYTALQNKVNNPDDTPTIDSMNLVTSDGVARAIENASAVWKGTRAEWNALPAADKIKYDLAVLLDQTLVKAIDRTDGTETNVADLSGQFVGTHAEWEAESNKTQYKTAVLTDDRKTVNEVTGTGALNEVADDARVWRGTQEEWDALTAAEKAEWNVAHIEDGSPVFSKHVFPDYAHPITIPSGTTTWTATEDVYVNFASINNVGTYCYLYADGAQISTYTWYDGGHGCGTFAGYIKKGTVLSAPLLYGTNICKIFPLL